MEDSRRGFAVSTASEKRLQHGSNSTAVTAGTVESEWESYLEDYRPVSLNPWDLYLAFRNAKLLTVEPVIFLYMFATYLYFPLSQQYYLSRFAAEALENTSYPYPNETHCLYKAVVDNYTGSNTTYDRYVEGKSTTLFIFCSLANRIPSIAVTLILGPLSDRYGRRLPILLVAVGSILGGLMIMAIVRFSLNVYFFILSSVIAGVFGDFASILMGSFSYISDISSGKWRTVRIGLAEAMLFLAGLLAEQLGGIWFQRLDCNILSPLILYVACNAAIILYTLIFLPPSLTREERRRKTLNSPKGVKALVRGVSLFCAVPEYPAWRLWLAIVSIVIFIVNMAGATSVDVFFFEDLNWGSSKIGTYGSIGMGSHMAVLLLVLPVLVALKFPDPLISIIGGLVSSTMNAFVGLSTKTYEFYIAATVQGLDAMIFPPLRSYMSKLVHVEDQGALFSVIASLESLASLVSIAYTFILPKVIDRGLSPGTTFLIMAALGLIPILLVSVLLIHWCKGKFFPAHKPLALEGSVSERTPILSNPHQNQSDKYVEEDTAQGYSDFPPPPPYTEVEGKKELSIN